MVKLITQLALNPEIYVYMNCENCSELLPHTIHGFINHNRRYKCVRCKEEIEDENND